MTTIPESDQNAIITQIQQFLIESGIPNLQMMAVNADDLIGRVESYQQRAREKYGDPYGNRTPTQIATFIYGEIAYDYGQSDAGM